MDAMWCDSFPRNEAHGAGFRRGGAAWPQRKGGPAAPRVVPRAERSAFDQLACMHPLTPAPAVSAASGPTWDPEAIALGGLGERGWLARAPDVAAPASSLR